GGGQGRKEVDLSDLILHQHLDDASGRAEVAVDLEGWVGVEQVGVNSTTFSPLPAGQGQQALQQAIRSITVVQTSPEVDLPRLRPSRPLVTAHLERLTGGREELRRVERVDLRPRMQ